MEPWPNATEILDGVVPMSEVSQEPTLLDDDEDLEMEDEDADESH